MTQHSDARLIGLISDTHGLLRASVHTALAGVDLILHAGDVGDDDVLAELATIAPTLAVSGNTDPPGWLPESLDLVLNGRRVHVSHGHETGSPTPEKLAARYDADVIVYGHTHVQAVAELNGTLVVNPGAAGARRFQIMPSVAILTLDPLPRAELVTIE